MLSILQTILANNNLRGNSWTQLLIIVAVVVVYGVKILSNIRKRSFTEDEDEQGSHESPQPPLQQQDDQSSEIKRLLDKSFPVVPLKKIKTLTKPEPAKIKLSALYEPESEWQEPERITSGLGLDLHDTDNLRKAIIYSEILGKPLALRQDG